MDDARLEARFEEIDKRLLYLLEALESNQKVTRGLTENMTILTTLVTGNRLGLPE